MPSVSRNRTQIQDVDFGYYLSHYSGLLLRRLWFIAIVGPLVTGTVMFGLLNVIAIDPSMRTRVLIGVDSREGESAGYYANSIDPNRVELIGSRTFLEGIVRQLSLQFVPGRFARGEVFDSIRVDSTSAIGSYTLELNEKNKQHYVIHYLRSEQHTKRVVAVGDISNSIVQSIPGMYLEFSPEYLHAPHEITFEIVETRKAVDALLEELEITAPNPHQRRNHIAVSLQGRDYELIATTANVIAREFVALNLNFRRRRTSETLKVLKEQLDRAAEQLRVSESALRSFLSENPTIALDQATRRTVSNISSLESGASDAELSLREAERLHERLRSADNDDQDQIVGEVLVFLADRSVPAAQVLADRFDELSEERESLAESYTSQHPMRKEFRSRFSSVYSGTRRALEDYLHNVRIRVREGQERIRNLSSRLHALPSKELRLAELERKHEIDSEIHGSILSRYNEARVEHAVEQPDVYIMDYAVPPIPPPPLVKFLQLAVFSLIVGTGVSVGPVVALDFLDKSVRSTRQLARAVPYPVLGALPVIRLEQRGRRTHAGLGADRGRENIALENGNVPQYVKEMFRSLRTRLQFEVQERNLRGFAVTSLNPGEGKSLITVNLAESFSRLGLKVLLIDTDLRKGTVHRLLDIPSIPGLSELVTMPGKPRTDLPGIDSIVRRTAYSNLHCIPCGTHTDDVQEILSSKRVRELLNGAEEHYDMIIIDTPPLAVASDTVVAGELIGGIFAVVKAGATNVQDLLGAIQEFPSIESNLFGVVLNQARLDRRLRYYRYSKYYVDSEGKK